MAKSHPLRPLALLVVLSMLAVACGQKEGVHQVGLARGGGQGNGIAAGGGGDGGFDAEGATDGGGSGFGTIGGETADPSGSSASGGSTGGSGSGGSSGGTTSGGGSTGTTGTGGTSSTGGGGGGGGGSGGGGGGGQPAGGGDTTGITDTTIKIGVHAPLTGAAPLPQASFQSGKDQYWRHVGEVFGRTVEVIVRDDKYTPSSATQVCNDLIQREEVFVLVGGGGADQIAACAQAAARQGVPYLSAGVDEGVLRQIQAYFALSMSYVQQAPLLVQWILKNARPSDGRLGILRDRTPGFNNVVNAVKAEAERAGLEVVVIQHQDANSDASRMSEAGLQTVFPIMAPSDFVAAVIAPGGGDRQYAGIGITMGLNSVTNAICIRERGYRAMFFSPFPGLNQIDKLDPAFNEASGGGDDIELALWGLNKSMHEVFKKLTPQTLHRQGFVQALQSNVIATNVYPELRHTPDNHFGAQSVHVLVAQCSGNGGTNVTPDDGLFRNSF